MLPDTDNMPHVVLEHRKTGRQTRLDPWHWSPEQWRGWRIVRYHGVSFGDRLCFTLMRFFGRATRAVKRRRGAYRDLPSRPGLRGRCFRYLKARPDAS